MYAAPRLEHELLGALDAGVTSVVVDLTECELIDSAALGVLACAGSHLRSSPGGLALITAARHIRAAFAMTGLDSELEIHMSRPRDAVLEAPA